MYVYVCMYIYIYIYIYVCIYVYIAICSSASRRPESCHMSSSSPGYSSWSSARYVHDLSLSIHIYIYIQTNNIHNIIMYNILTL